MRDGKDWVFIVHTDILYGVAVGRNTVSDGITNAYIPARSVFKEVVCPICQLRGVMCQEVERRPSLAVTRNDNDCPVKSTLVCQRCPQFLDMAVHPTLFPLICMLWTSPAPATFHTRTRRK
ncbi:hypothetical protein MUK42_01869 [Musa troglodytarum]|uniref:Uncharacterized protein n=1 Tax=Musa troglodytarum TaxID=320322 RepID=A0A9E7EID5_9LILI|nr:hypothetical protein MUK42_01869 [Musa troglodytarum]